MRAGVGEEGITAVGTGFQAVGESLVGLNTRLHAPDFAQVFARFGKQISLREAPCREAEFTAVERGKPRPAGPIALVTALSFRL